MNKKLNELALKMTELYSDDPKRIQHFIKVHAFAKLIGEEEKLSEKTLYILETAAYIHDIAIRYCEKKYNGRCGGALQEKEGSSLARDMLTDLGFDSDIVERVCYLVGHHHTYTNIDGDDYRILVEADFIVNLYEDNATLSAKKKALKNVFRSKTGILLFRILYGV